jgi:hypothetical protein
MVRVGIVYEGLGRRPGFGVLPSSLGETQLGAARTTV